MKKILSIICFVILLGSCAEMNDKHDGYLENGRIIYIGKIDSVKVFSGNERILFRCWLSDPRAKHLSISWSSGKESAEFPVPEAHQPGESLDVTIGKPEKTIAEDSYTFNLVVWDDHGNKSVVVETNAKVYGQKYQSLLTNRPLISAEAIGNDVMLKWAGYLNVEESGINVSYTNTAGAVITHHYTSSEASTVIISGVKLTEPVTWQTLYIPEPTAIDTFSTLPQNISVESVADIQLDKSKFAPLPKSSKFIVPSYATSNLNVLWDGNIGGLTNNDIYMLENAGRHQPYIAFDLGVKVKLTRLCTWDRYDFYFRLYGSKRFSIFGTNDPNVANNPESEDSEWILLNPSEFVSVRPSGKDNSQAVAINDGVDWDHALAGQGWEFPANVPAVRYIRYKNWENWGGGATIANQEYGFSLVEITLWGGYPVVE